MHEAVINSLHVDGYALLPDVFNPDEIQALRTECDALLDLARGLPQTSDIDGSRFVIDPDPFRLHRVVWAGGCRPLIKKLGEDPRFTALATAALGHTELVQIIQQVHFKLPGDGVDFNWHQDASNRRYGTDLWHDSTGAYLQMILAIDPMTPENGPLQVLPQSHRLGFVADPQMGTVPQEILDRYPRVDLLMKPGDLAIFGPFLIHGSTQNNSSASRRILLQGYTLPGVNHRIYPGCGIGQPIRLG